MVLIDYYTTLFAFRQNRLPQKMASLFIERSAGAESALSVGSIACLSLSELRIALVLIRNFTARASIINWTGYRFVIILPDRSLIG
jgi:hypothetical protein